MPFATTSQGGILACWPLMQLWKKKKHVLFYAEPESLKNCKQPSEETETAVFLRIGKVAENCRLKSGEHCDGGPTGTSRLLIDA